MTENAKRFWVGFLVGWLFWQLVFSIVGWFAEGIRSNYLFRTSCEKDGYYVLSDTKRIKCTVEKLEWEKAE